MVPSLKCVFCVHCVYICVFWVQHSVDPYFRTTYHIRPYFESPMDGTKGGGGGKQYCTCCVGTCKVSQFCKCRSLDYVIKYWCLYVDCIASCLASVCVCGGGG